MSRSSPPALPETFEDLTTLAHDRDGSTTEDHLLICHSDLALRLGVVAAG